MNSIRPDQELRAVVRDGITRGVGAIALAGIALIHAIDAPSHFVGGSDTYLGVMYIGLIVSCLVLATGLIVRSDRRIWLAIGGLTATVILGFVLSRTSGLPGDSGDIGNWGEALGIASLFIEGSVLALGAGVLVFGIAEPATAGEVADRRAVARASTALVANDPGREPQTVGTLPAIRHPTADAAQRRRAPGDAGRRAARPEPAQPRRRVLPQDPRRCV